MFTGPRLDGGPSEFHPPPTWFGPAERAAAGPVTIFEATAVDFDTWKRRRALSNEPALASQLDLEPELEHQT